MLIRFLIAYCVSQALIYGFLKILNLKSIFFKMVISFLVTYLFLMGFTLEYKFSLIISLICSLVIGVGLYPHENEKVKKMPYLVLVLPQILSVLIIIVFWAIQINKIEALLNLILGLLTNYKISVVLLAYCIVIWPVSWVIEAVLQSLSNKQVATSPDNLDNIPNAGNIIGQFERVIILTLVLLQQYDAIGFLITGKSIIRFASTREHLKSEYVLVGTMMSYALSILFGEISNWLLKF